LAFGSVTILEGPRRVWLESLDCNVRAANGSVNKPGRERESATTSTDESEIPPQQKHVHARAAELIAALDLRPHAEGGYFREIHRSALQVDPQDGRGQRAALTTIYFLLVAGEVSRWHRVASDEAWHFLEGDSLDLYEAHGDFERVVTTRLGRHDVSAEPVHVIVAGSWQAARSRGGYTLVACTVGPGFDYADFALLRASPTRVAALERNYPELISLV
jgi:predicted cupin superfamily sugar epimerase